jgi:sugar phosphate isomerase/epimerase
MVKVACQLIVFGNHLIKDNIETIAETAKKIGYDGLEIGARHLNQDKPQYYQDLFGKLNIKLAALHVGGDFTDKASVQQQLDNMRTTISFGKKLGCPYIFLSGSYKEGKTPENYITEADSYKEIGRACNAEGLILCYHNHAWEFNNDGEGMNILMEKIPTDLMKLVPDVGWVEMGGFSSVQFVKEHIDRIEALHFKDFKSKKTPREFTELGTGLVPFKEVYDYVTTLNKDWWISAEQDQTLLEPKEAARINYEYIKGLGK